MKTCQRCSLTRPLEQFGKNPRTRDGFKSWCNACVAEYARSRRTRLDPAERTARQTARNAAKREATRKARLHAGEKFCSDCSTTKPLSAFNLDPRYRDGFCSYCKACVVRRAAEWRKANPDKAALQAEAARIRQRNRPDRDKRAAYLKHHYGLTIEEWEAMHARQGDACAICHIRPSRLHVDHDATTGKIRGLLCGLCNRGIGLLDHSPVRLMAAASYLIEISPTAP